MNARPSTRPLLFRAVGWMAACLALFSGSFAADAPSSARPPSVGMEAILRTNLPGTLLVPKPVAARAPILLRVAESRPHGTLIAYEFRYVGLEPGSHDLRDYLARADGSTLDDLSPLRVQIHSVLPPQHDGLLIPQDASTLRRLGGYRIALISVTVLWALLLIPFLRGPRSARFLPPAPAPVPPSIADQLRPLIERAAVGQLDTEGKARLERLVLGHWREQLQLGHLSPAQSLATLRTHPEGGAILRLLEDWLHRRPSTRSVDLEPLLEPYRRPHPTSPPTASAPTRADV